MKTIHLRRGDILLTAGVGGPAAKWRDRALANAILRCQRKKMTGFRPTRSHAELITNGRGQTFAARWRTRKRDNGLNDYLGSQITIIRIKPEIQASEFDEAWELADMDALDNKIYPLYRILLLGLTSTIAPAWLDEIGIFPNSAMCSELVARFFRALRTLRRPEHGNDYLRFVEDGWKGIMPGHIEQASDGREFEIIFNGGLTVAAMKNSGLPIFND